MLGPRVSGEVSPSFDLGRLPEEVRDSVREALVRGEGHAEAIASIEGALERGAERSRDLLVALATLTYEDAATLVLSRLEAASREALALLDEASEGESSPELLALSEAYARTLAREEARELHLRGTARGRSRPRALELIELAHRVLMSGEDDGLAAELMVRAARESEPPEAYRRR